MNTTRESRSDTVRRMEADRKRLTAAGWTHVCSVMSGDKGDRDYGLLFTRKGEKFYLNVETRDRLPV